MERLKSVGHAVGEYVGNGQGDAENVDPNLEDASGDVDLNADPSECNSDTDKENEDGSDSAQPLLFLYDCETTGFSIYDDHITELAAKVVGIPVSSVSQPIFSKLVRTTRRIPPKGKVFRLVLLGGKVIKNVRHCTSTL